MSIELEWYGYRIEDCGWDACEVTVELADRVLSLCPLVAILPGVEERVVFTVDVPDGRGDIRSIAVGFASTIEEAKSSVVDVIERIKSGLQAV